MAKQIAAVLCVFSKDSRELHILPVPTSELRQLESNHDRHALWSFNIDELTSQGLRSAETRVGASIMAAIESRLAGAIPGADYFDMSESDRREIEQMKSDFKNPKGPPKERS